MMNKITFSRTWSAGLLCAALLTTDASATVRRVSPTGTGSTGTSWSNSDAYGNLQNAITASSSGDTLWVKTGTYQPGAGSSFAMKEGVVMLGGFSGTETVATDRNWDLNRTILKGNGSSVIINGFSSATPMTSLSVLDGFTVTGGKTSTYGGGMHNTYASPTVRNCIFSKDTASHGGGMANFYSAPVVSRTTFKQCRTSGAGGAIYNSVTDGTFTDLLVDSNFCASYGGGISNWYTGSHFSRIVFSNNESGLGGGGMCNIYASATLTGDNIVFFNNKTTSGFGGGGFWNYEGTANLTNVTFVNNAGNVGGGVSSTDLGTVDIKNAIFWTNTAVTGAADIYTSGGTHKTIYSFTQTTISDTGNILGTASPFVNVSNPQGADGIWMTEDDGLKPAASATVRDAGSPIGVPLTDILGRSRSSGGGVDMGAYEALLRWYVKADATGTNTGSSWANAFTSLQQAIDSAKATAEIWVAAGTYLPTKDAAGNTSPANNRDKTFLLKDSVKIYGGFNGTESSVDSRAGLFSTTIISGDLGATPTTRTDDAHHLMIATELSAATVLDGLTLAYGSASGSSNITVNSYLIDRFRGGAIYMANSDLQLANLTIRDNIATYGGGLYVDGGMPAVNKCLLRNNTATTQGGAMFNYNTNPVIAQSVFERNKATNGGAMSSHGGTTYTVSLDHTIFRENEGTTLGGAMDNNANVNGRNLVFSKNRGGATGGGGIFHNSAGLTLQNSAFYGNSISGSFGPELRVTGGTSVVTYCYTESGISGTGNITGFTDPFVNSESGKGADSLWWTGDDGLQLPFCSTLINAGDTTGVAATDILGRPRIRHNAVDIGAYEKQSDITDFENNARLSSSSANGQPFYATCDDGEWTYYADPTQPDSLSFAVAWGTANDVAKANATTSITLDAANTAATSATDGIWTMRRYWSINLDSDTLVEPVKVRFFYNPADTVAMHAAAQAWNMANGSGLYRVGTIKWFKTVGAAFSPAMVEPLDINNGDKYVLKPISYGSDNGVAYVQFDSVSSFSGGTAALGGEDGIDALPVDLISFTAAYADKGTAVQAAWQVGTEQARYYQVQRSTDGRSFSLAGTVQAANGHNYRFKDVLPAALQQQPLFYRLLSVDAAAKPHYSQVVRLTPGAQATQQLIVAPNPADAAVTITYTGTALDGSKLRITDISGRVQAVYSMVSGMSLDISSWVPGSYLLHLADGQVIKLHKK